MDIATRSVFLQQLSLWATKHIASGNSPFRKVQIKPQIVTSAGVQHPDLVFWINKDSFVSGGFILCVDSDDVDLDRARACATALGVCYFASWSSHKVTIWNATLAQPHQEPLTLTTTSADNTKAFEDTLIALMDQLRILAVLGTSPPQQLSYWHLTNLFFTTTTKAHTALSKHLRSQPKLHNKQMQPISDRAQDKIHLCTARMIILTYFAKIPHNLQPEQLDNALRYLTSDLNKKEFSGLAPQVGECDLDEHSTVALHHLLHRLEQVSLFHDRERASELLRQLLVYSAPGANIGGNCQCADGHIYLYCNNTHSCGKAAAITEIDTPARIALKQLLHTLLDQPCRPNPRQSVFELESLKEPCKASGFLFNGNRPDLSHHNIWSKRLKLAWAGTTFSLPRSTPIWAYELIYLLGVLAPQSKIDLHLPAGLFTSEYSTTLVTLLQRNFTLHTISQQQSAMIDITATKERGNEDTTIFSASHKHASHKHTTHKRAIPWSTLIDAPPEFFALALNLDDALFQLIINGDLRFEPKQSDTQQAGVACYLNSSLAMTLRHHLSTTHDTKWQPRIPFPRAIVLDTLASIECSQNNPPERKRIDNELAKQLNLSSSFLPSKALLNTEAPRTLGLKNINKAIRQKIIKRVELHGVPQFPTHYLYDYYRPQLADYSVKDRPWNITSEFMGTFQLRSSGSSSEVSGYTLNVDNEYLAYAIVLASFGTAEIKLPANMTIVEKITRRYLEDLQELHTIIWSEAHAALSQHEMANRTVAKVWKALGLPPWKTVKSLMNTLRIPT